jgi:hypothetical protein
MSALARKSQSPQRQPHEKVSVLKDNELTTSEAVADGGKDSKLAEPICKAVSIVAVAEATAAAEIVPPCYMDPALNKSRANSDACIPDDLKALTSGLFALLDEEEAPSGEGVLDEKETPSGEAVEKTEKGSNVSEGRVNGQNEQQKKAGEKEAAKDSLAAGNLGMSDNQQRKLQVKKEKVAQALKSRKESAARVLSKGREQASIALQRKKAQASVLKQKSVEQAAGLKQKLWQMRGQKQEVETKIEPEFCIEDEDEESAREHTVDEESARNMRTGGFVRRPSAGHMALKREQVSMALQRKKQQAAQMKQKLSASAASGLSRFSRNKGKSKAAASEIEVEVDLGTYGAF